MEGDGSTGCRPAQITGGLTITASHEAPKGDENFPSPSVVSLG